MILGNSPDRLPPRQAVNGAPIEGRSQWVIANALVGDRDAEVTLTVVTPGQGAPHRMENGARGGGGSEGSIKSGCGA